MERSIRALAPLNFNETAGSHVSVRDKSSLDDTPVGSPSSDGQFQVLLCFQWLLKKKQASLEMRSLMKNFKSQRAFTMTVCKMANLPKAPESFKPVFKVRMLPENKQWWSELPGEDDDVAQLYHPFQYYTDSLEGKTIVIEVYNRKITRNGEVYGTLKIRGEDLIVKDSCPVQRWFKFEGDGQFDF